MKKIVSFVLVAIMIACSLVVSTSAAGTLYFDADFSSDASFSKYFFPEAYFTNENCAVGYSDARALQTSGKWATYDVTYNVIFNEDEVFSGAEDRTLSFVYLNNARLNEGIADERLVISFCINITNGELSLVEGDFSPSETTTALAAPIEFPVEDGKEYNFGVSVMENHIRVFEGSNLLFEYVDTEGKYCIGKNLGEGDAELLLWWNTGNYITYTDIKLASPAYFYPMQNAPATNNTSTTAPEATTRIENVEVTDDKGNAVTDAEGNKVTEQVVITDAPVADTNTGAPQGGNSTSTGDNTFVVVAAMVASFGCAIIVRKVYTK